ncbi:MAG: hypothetical protein R3E04_04880 [Sphingobium sp.]
MYIDRHITADSARAPTAARFAVLYRGDSENFCPCCGRRQWIIGRLTAECAFCDAALPLDHIAGHGYSPRFVTPDVSERAPLETLWTPLA